MSLVDRWLSRSAQEAQAATFATSATIPRKSSIPAEFSVATDLRHVATSAPAAAGPLEKSQAVADGLRHEKPQYPSAFEPMSQMSQLSQGSPAEIAADPAWWRNFYEARAAIRQRGDERLRADAERLAWGEAQWRWHKAHGERVSQNLCAGCRLPIGTEAPLDLIDGNRVHDRAGHDCLIRHGERWRGAATAALMALGLLPPAVMLAGKLIAAARPRLR